MNVEDLARDATSRDPNTPLFGIGWHRHADGRWVWGALYGDGCAACDAAWRSAVPAQARAVRRRCSVRRVPPSLIVAVAGEVTGLDLRTCTRAAAYVAARSAAASVMREMGLSYPAIASALGWACHDTAIHAVRNSGRAEVQDIRSQVVARLSATQPEGVSIDAELSRLRAALDASEHARAHLELEVRALTRTIDRIAVERDAARRTEPKQAKTRQVRHDAGEGRIAPKPGVKPARQRFGNMVVERLPDGRVVTRKVA